MSLPKAVSFASGWLAGSVVVVVGREVDGAGGLACGTAATETGAPVANVDGRGGVPGGVPPSSNLGIQS
jgi:hypothetical protein